MSDLFELYADNVTVLQANTDSFLSVFASWSAPVVQRETEPVQSESAEQTREGLDAITPALTQQARLDSRLWTSVKMDFFISILVKIM